MERRVRRKEAGRADGPLVTRGGKCRRAIARTPHADGDVLTFGQHEARVFSVPGHTSGSAAFLSLLALHDRLVADTPDVRWLVPAHSAGVEGRRPLTDLAEGRR